MTDLIGKNVYMVLYNYIDNDYSVVKIINNLDLAFNHICQLENATYGNKKKNIRMVEITNQHDIIKNNNNNNDLLSVCYMTGKYQQLSLEENENISQYIIVPMKIE
jgi:hypothetical protein